MTSIYSKKEGKIMNEKIIITGKLKDIKKFCLGVTAAGFVIPVLCFLWDVSQGNVKSDGALPFVWLIVPVFALIAFGVTGIIIALGAEMNDVLVIFVNSMVLLSGMVSALNFGRRIFKELKSGETPFRYDIADKVRGAFFALMGVFCFKNQTIFPFLSKRGKGARQMMSGRSMASPSARTAILPTILPPA
jgi:hypothetical protein